MGKNNLGYTITMQDGNTWITYKRVSSVEIEVVINDKYAGSIRQVANGWQYTPRGHKQGRAVCSSLRAAKNDIERGD